MNGKHRSIYTLLVTLLKTLVSLFQKDVKLLQLLKKWSQDYK